MSWEILCVIYAEDTSLPRDHEVRCFGHDSGGGRMVSTWSHSCGQSRPEGACQAKEGGDPIVKKKGNAKSVESLPHVVSSVFSSIS